MTHAYDKDVTALLLIDPYNDFISQGGKIWNRIRAVAEANGCVPHMLQILNAARQAKLRVFYAMHHRYRPGDYETWKYIAPIQKAAWMRKVFECGTWGDDRGALEFQRLRQHRPGSAAQEARPPSPHRHRAHCSYLRRSDGPFCRWL